jgi:PAS domain S-box-containing protein
MRSMDTENPASLSRLILEQMADAVIYANASGIIELWNAAAVSLFGYGPGEAIGQSLDLIIPAHLQERHWHGFRTAMDTGVTRLEGCPTVTRAQHQSGNALYVEMTFALVEAPAVAPCGAVAVARDVTARVKQQRAAARKDAVGDS